MLPVDYITITLNAVFTGLGVAVGGEIHGFIKARRAKLKEVYEGQFKK